MKSVYSLVKEFKDKYPMTIAWRIKSHAKIVEKHLNPGEEVLYAFAGQKGEFYKDLFHTFIVVLTNERILLAQKRVFFGYFCISITPDLFNDLTVEAGIVWGKVNIDTVNEQVTITNIDKKSLAEVETAISSYMMETKKKYKKNERAKNDD